MKVKIQMRKIRVEVALDYPNLIGLTCNDHDFLFRNRSGAQDSHVLPRAIHHCGWYSSRRPAAVNYEGDTPSQLVLDFLRPARVCFSREVRRSDRHRSGKAKQAARHRVVGDAHAHGWTA